MNAYPKTGFRIWSRDLQSLRWHMAVEWWPTCHRVWCNNLVSLHMYRLCKWLTFRLD